ncbi:TIGR02757 family protein [Weeksellaceae bacterium TAE3-ERU29]|nr:TIGR02757 family protein [Weeksellaceae bacterium TAE3-ERU29]
MNKTELKEFLDFKVNQYNNPNFIEEDPIQVPHLFNKKEDIEIAGYLSATIAWGNRKSIIKNAKNMILLMDSSPHDFVINHSESDLEKLLPFVHRTFNSDDFIFIIKALKRAYTTFDSLEDLFLIKQNEKNPMFAIDRFRDFMLAKNTDYRTKKHISSPAKNSAAKRINMFLRWMARKDNNGVDFGIWENIPQSKLSIPLDVHSGNTARALKLLDRKQNDKKAVESLDFNLRKLDSKDPVKYDFALFGIGVSKDL